MHVLTVKQCFLLPALLAAGNIAAQTLSFSNVPRINQRGGYNRVIGENTEGIYLLRLRNAEGRGMVSLEHYTHSLTFQEEKTYRLGAERLVKAHLLGQRCLLFTAANDRQRGICALGFRKLNSGLAEEQQGRLLEFDRYDFYKNQVLGTTDRSGRYLLFYADSRDGQGRQILDLAMLDTALNPVFREQKTLETAAESFRLIDLEADPEGNVYLLASEQQKDRKKTDPASIRIVIYIYMRRAQQWSRNELSEPSFFLNSARMCYNDSLKRVVFSGFYSSGSSDGADGVYMAVVSTDHPAGIKGTKAAFSSEFIANIIGAKLAESTESLNNFRIRKMVPRSDGGLLVVAECYYVTQRVETTYISGISQTNTTNYYHHDEVILLSLDSDGNIEWHELIRKKQSSLYAASMFSGIAVCAVPDAVLVVFNEAANGDVVQYKFQKDGRRDHKILLRSESSFTALIPGEGTQTGYNRMILPCLRNRQISLLKLTY